MNNLPQDKKEKVLKLKLLLRLENSFFVSFKLSDIDCLQYSIISGRGFILVRVFPHQRKKNWYILEIKTLNSENKGLQFKELKARFTVNNQKKASPNLSHESSLSVYDFESTNKIFIGRPKSSV